MGKNKTSVKSVQQNMLYNTAGSLIYYFCQWVMTILIVRLSGFEDAGLLSLAMSATAAPAIIGLFNVRSFQVSDIEGSYTNKEYVYARFVSCILAVFVCLGVVVFYGYSLDKALIIMTYMLFKVVECIADVFYGIDQKNQRMDYVGLSLTARGIGTLICFVCVFRLTGSLLWSIAAMSLISLAVVLLYDVRVAQRYRQEGDEKGRILWGRVRQLLITCLPLAVVAFLNNLSLTIPKLYLEQFYGEEVMGIYSSVSSPTIVIQLAATTLFAPMIPPLTKEFASGNKKGFLGGLRKFFGLIAGLALLAVILSKILGRWALILLFGEEIDPYVYLFVPVIILAILIAVNASLFSICTLMRAIKIQYTIGVAGIGAALIGALTVVKSSSMDGVIWALGITLCVQIVIQVVIIVWRLYRVQCH